MRMGIDTGKLTDIAGTLCRAVNSLCWTTRGLRKTAHNFFWGLNVVRAWKQSRWTWPYVGFASQPETDMISLTAHAETLCLYWKFQQSFGHSSVVRIMNPCFGRTAVQSEKRTTRSSFTWLDDVLLSMECRVSVSIFPTIFLALRRLAKIANFLKTWFEVFPYNNIVRLNSMFFRSFVLLIGLPCHRVAKQHGHEQDIGGRG